MEKKNNELETFPIDDRPGFKPVTPPRIAGFSGLQPALLSFIDFFFKIFGHFPENEIKAYTHDFAESFARKEKKTRHQDFTMSFL